MADHRGDEEESEAEQDRDQPMGARTPHQPDHQRRHHIGLQPDERAVHPISACAERQHEGQQEQRQRHDPEERRRCDVGRDVRSHGDQQRRRHEGKRHPGQPRRP
jgi:hypothetical protein